MKKLSIQSGLLLLLIFSVCIFASNAQTGKVFVDKEGKQYANTENDCKFANFTKLNKEIAPRGFAAGPDGGYVKTNNVYYCNPCVKYTGANKPKEFKQISALYKPIEPLIYKHARGASYEYCTIKGIK